MAAPAPAPAIEGRFDVGTGRVDVMFADQTADQIQTCQNRVASAPAPPGLSTADIGLWRNQETAQCQGTLKQQSVADLVLNGVVPYSDLVIKGQSAPTKTAGYPDNFTSIQMDTWPVDTELKAYPSTASPGHASLQFWDLKDTQGQLKELVYTDGTGKSNVIFKSSTTSAEHVVSLTPGGSKVVGDVSVASVPVVTEETTGTSVTVYIGGSSCVLLLAVIIGFLALRRR